MTDKWPSNELVKADYSDQLMCVVCGEHRLLTRETSGGGVAERKRAHSGVDIM
jgi:hypothetical protein